MLKLTKTASFWKWVLFLSFAAAIIVMSCGDYLQKNSSETASLPEVVDFNFHIKPILSDRCFNCHGPDEGTRKADLRLDIAEDAFAKLKSSSTRAFVPHKPHRSEALNRIISDDPDYQMPPPESNLSVTEYETALIEKWIDQGAEWKNHWAFLPPQKSELPSESSAIWSNTNEIDPFIIRKAKEKNLVLTAEASPERLLRRVYMDLTGLPPSVDEIDRFVADPSFESYEAIVDHLLNSDAHAERLAMEWMDVARYADSHGLHADGWRNMYPWRDWVIKAFKANMSYYDFIKKQLAGDMLPNATKDDIIATGFNRNHPMTAEGGAVDEEWRLNYVFDRTETMSTALLGLTVGCAKCHDHKYDPISQKEYYELASFFNNVKEVGMTGDDGNYGPVLMLTDEETQQQLTKIDQQIRAVTEKIEIGPDHLQKIKGYIDGLSTREPDGLIAHVKLESKKKIKHESGRELVYFDQNEKAFTTGEGKLVKGKEGKALLFEKDFSALYIVEEGSFELYDAFSAGAWINTEQIDPKKTQTIIGNSGEKNNFWRGWDLYLDEENRLNARLISTYPHNYSHVRSSEIIDTSVWSHAALSYDGSAKAEGLQIFINGESVKNEVIYDNLSKSIYPIKVATHTPDDRPLKVGKSGRSYTGENGIFVGKIDEIKIFNTNLSPLEIRKMANLPEMKGDQSSHIIAKRKVFKKENNYVTNLRKQKLEIQNGIEEIMVMNENDTPNKMYIYHRGEYDKPTEEVSAATPLAVMDFPEGINKDRLGLVDWVFHEDNPLAARVAVNRYWQLIFGRGLVSTPEDFGMQGALPSHPELLDHLALEFVESNWDLRALIKKMVLSATYRQSSITTKAEREKDPENVYLARGSSYRLSAEMIRDNALAASGLISPQIGGESVKPYQPEGLWIEMGNFSHKLLKYKETKGDSLYRRSMYTFVRRTSPHPMMTTFDAPSREVCIMKRENTSTPLQALVLMNDPQFVEAAKVLAQRMQMEGGDSLEEMINFGFKCSTGRSLNQEEKELFVDLYQSQLEQFQSAPKNAQALLEIGEYELDKDMDKVKTAALAIVSNTMLNHDDAYMKR